MATSPRRVIVYMPSILSQMSGDSAGALATRIASALNRFDPESANRYSVSAEERFEIKQLPSSRVTILKQTPAGSEPVLDVADFPYPALLFQRFSKANPLLQAVRIILLIVARLPRIVFVMKGRVGKGAVERMQIVYGALILFALVLYLPLLLSTALITAGGAAGIPPLSLPDLPLGWIPGPLRGGAAWIGAQLADKWPWVESFFLASVGVGVLTRVDVKELWNRATQYVVPAMEYLGSGAHAGSMMGRLADLLEHLTEAEDRSYEAMEVWGYSFGTVIALDTLFPPSGSTVSRRLDLVDRLVTIGAPVGFVNIFYPRYFHDRGKGEPATSFTWVNVYNRRDLLGTAFRTPEALREGLRVPEEELDYTPGRGEVSGYRLGGFSAHQQYWDRGDVGGDSNAVDRVVEKLGPSALTGGS